MFGRDGARRRATAAQYVLALAAWIAFGWLWRGGPVAPLHLAHGVLRDLFLTIVASRILLLLVSRPSASMDWTAEEAELPRYSLILPLFREAAVVPALARSLRALDYPVDKLEFLFALEDGDEATWEAVRREPLPNKRVIRSAPGGPQTKPHACNTALAAASGELVVVFDAEDRPDPLQLREAAARFAAGPQDLVCLQAPLRGLPSQGFLKRQFALEYAALFDSILPALARLGLPFPLGGTSNHFRSGALRAIGGWDAYNVTEDADIGLRLGACGGRLGLLTRPTHEPAPPTLDVWTPQRTRWIKGHLHTWLIHMRRPLAGGVRSLLALQLTLGISVLSSLLHGFLATGICACLLYGLAGLSLPALSAGDFGLLVAGYGGAMLTMAQGARRAGFPVRWTDLALAPLYWPLQSLAGVFARWELASRPHHWNKTPHAAGDVEETASWLRPAA